MKGSIVQAYFVDGEVIDHMIIFAEGRLPLTGEFLNGRIQQGKYPPIRQRLYCAIVEHSKRCGRPPYFGEAVDHAVTHDIEVMPGVKLKYITKEEYRNAKGKERWRKEMSRVRRG